jgi:hypothetical protein
MLISHLALVSTLLSQGLPAPRRVIEGERLIESGRATLGSLLEQDMTDFGPDWGDHAQLYWPVHEVGAQLVLRPEVTRPGRYDVYVDFTQAPDYGRVSVRLDSGRARTFDGYAPTVRPFRFRLGTADLTAGRHELTITVIGTNKTSGDYSVGVDRIELVPVRARAPRSL